MKHLTILTSSLLLLTSSLSAGSPVSAAPRGGVPLRWTVETSRAQPATFDEFAGATYDLEATLQSYGRPLEVVGEPHLYWQTNGMGAAYWTAPATVSGNVLRATWTPACDVGARAYNCFIGITGTVYNAAFQLRLRPSPGAVPNVIDQPPRVLDLEHTIVINPPWPTDATISERIREVIDEDGITAPVETNVVTSIISNTVTKSYVEDLGISGGGTSGVDTNAVRDIALWPATNYTDRATGEVIRSVGALADTKRDLTNLTVYAVQEITEWVPDAHGQTLGLTGQPNIEWYGDENPGRFFCTWGDYISYDNGPEDETITFRIFGPDDEFTAHKSVRRDVYPTSDTIALTSQLQPPPVTSVNSQTGAVTLSASDVGAATTKDLTDAISTNNPAFVSAVRDTPPDEDTPWGTYGTLGAAIAGIIAVLANKLTKGLDAQGVPTDPNVVELFSESDTSTAANPDLNNKVLQASVNKLIDAKVGDVNAVLAAALDGTEVA